jgi:hypothetical protein
MVAVDLDTKEVSVDNDRFLAVAGDEDVWDTAAESWDKATDDELDEGYDTLTKLLRS